MKKVLLGLLCLLILLCVISTFTPAPPPVDPRQVEVAKCWDKVAHDPSISPKDAKMATTFCLMMADQQRINTEKKLKGQE
jgi:hypothetical protein